ncbi:major facilitator superfamily transporter [Hortaea werneckii]|nr:major facilitator superfamily transporter [Hortaea werneckii]
MELDASTKGATIESGKQAAGHVEVVDNTERALLDRYALLKDLSQEELDKLDKAVVRKLDWVFLPCVTLMLLMNYLDRINVSNARLAGMQSDLNMTDVEWSAGISLFYVGYIISQIPANVFIAKGKPRVLLPACMLGWSCVTICMPAMKSPWAFMLCRFLVGITEGPFLPAVSVITSSWYTRQESPMRMGLWHAGNVTSNIFSGLMAAGILTGMDNLAGLHSWQWFFLIEGAFSIIVAMSGFWLIPNWPHNTPTYYFSPQMAEMAQYRSAVSAGGRSEDDEGGYFDGIRQAAKDPFTWMFAALHFFLILSQSFKDFLPSIVKTFGFSEVGTYLIQAPPYLVAYIVMLALSWSSGRTGDHAFHIIGAILMCMVGAVIMISTLNPGARYFSVFLLCSGPFLGLNLQLAWETTVVPRPRTKRAALVAIANCVSSVTHWFSPYAFLRSQEPRYATGGGLMIAGCGLTVFAALLLRWWARRKNKQIHRREEQTGEVTTWRFATVIETDPLVVIVLTLESHALRGQYRSSLPATGQILISNSCASYVQGLKRKISHLQSLQASKSRRLEDSESRNRSEIQVIPSDSIPTNGQSSADLRVTEGGQSLRDALAEFGHLALGSSSITTPDRSQSSGGFAPSMSQVLYTALTLKPTLSQPSQLHEVDKILASHHSPSRPISPTRETTSALFEIYTSIILPRFPFMDASNLDRYYIKCISHQMQLVPAGSKEPYAYEFFLVYMAIATAAFASASSPRIFDFGTQLFTSVTQHLPDLTGIAGPQVTVQCLTALALGSLYNPHQGSPWYLLGIAVAGALSSGMHRWDDARLLDTESPRKAESERLLQTLYVLDRPEQEKYRTPLIAHLHYLDGNSVIRLWTAHAAQRAMRVPMRRYYKVHLNTWGWNLTHVWIGRNLISTTSVLQTLSVPQFLFARPGIPD